MFKKLGKKTKALGVVAATTILTTASQAAPAEPTGVTFNHSTGAFEGAVNLGAYYSGVEIAVAVVGVTIAISLFFSMLRKARS